MTESQSLLPEELLLSIFSHLDTLRDLYAVKRTCKTFHRISQDLTPPQISQIALRTGETLPALFPSRHFLILAALPRLKQWAVQNPPRPEHLRNAMQNGLSHLAAFILTVAPLTLADIQRTWTWKQTALVPLSAHLRSEILPRDGGNPNDKLHAWPVGECITELAELILWAWTLAGEFSNGPPALDLTSPDWNLREPFLEYCAVDMSSVTAMDRRLSNMSDTESRRRFLDSTPDATQRRSCRAVPCYFDEMRKLFYDGVLDGIGDLVPSVNNVENISIRTQARFTGIFRKSGWRGVEVLNYGLAPDSERGPLPYAESVVRWLEDALNAAGLQKDRPLLENYVDICRTDSFENADAQE